MSFLKALHTRTSLKNTNQQTTRPRLRLHSENCKKINWINTMLSINFLVFFHLIRKIFSLDLSHPTKIETDLSKQAVLRGRYLVVINVYNSYLLT